MRPGPGLVVMALAFISGARRGSSSSISSTTTTTTASTSIGTTSAGAAGAAAVGAGGAGGTGGTGATAAGTEAGGPGGGGLGGGHRGGGVGTALPSRGESSSFISSSGSYLLPIFLPHHLDLYRRPTPQAIYQLPPTYQHAHDHDDPRARTEALSARLQR
ncbi:GL17164 [Drosophila persimilis]|uniref:GL17164 n=2 Tax=Drosophila persimilis TaxID=7234 RepID=B4GGB8_DROPE|nr:GL17164 [Drosophila persimilis]